MRRLVAIAVVAVASLSCGGEDNVATPPYGLLSQYGFFKGDGHTQEPATERVIPYDVASPLFADFAGKHRFIVLPQGGKITYKADDKWDFPAGTFIVKTFFYGSGGGTRLIETRVLIKETTGWLPTTYLWNEAQTEATLQLIGSRAQVTTPDDVGGTVSLEYRVPNQNQCYGCHGAPTATNVLGLRTRQLNRMYDYGAGPVNQLDHLVSLGAFDGALPAAGERAALPDPYGTAATLDQRARAWLESNCAHCHSPAGAAGSTNLYLATDITKPLDFGVCRLPNAAGAGTGGRKFDIVAGKPDESIMTFRIASTDPGVKMPEMPIQLVDHRGVELITAWIAAMSPAPCNP